MVGIKDFGMPSCCQNCDLWQYDRNDEPKCNITLEKIFDFNERNSDCPLVAIDESNDCVSRKEAIKEMNAMYEQNVKQGRSDDECFDAETAVAILEDLRNVRPSQSIIINGDMSANNTKVLIDQELKTGYWFVDERPESDREIICSNCEQPIFKYHKLDFDYRPKYCPNCGAKMVEP